jgi:hypothetical protein
MTEDVEHRNDDGELQMIFRWLRNEEKWETRDGPPLRLTEAEEAAYVVWAAAEDAAYIESQSGYDRSAVTE